MSDAVLATLLSRRSVPAEALMAPGPDEAQLAAAIDAALRAPDHGRLRPWRFRVVRSEAARGALSALLARFAEAAQLPPAQAEKIRSRPLRVPLVVVASAQLKDHPKVPEVEQLLAAGAGVMNLLNALHAQGFGAVWLTGPPSYDASVAEGLGLAAGERLLGFVYAGTIAPDAPPPPARPDRAGFVLDWPA